MPPTTDLRRSPPGGLDADDPRHGAKRKAAPDRIKVGYYITTRARDRLHRLAQLNGRSISRQIEALIDEETARAGLTS